MINFVFMMKSRSVVVILSLCFTALGILESVGQSIQSCDQLLDQIGAFEGQRDPKCAATANRLEDFMYGTPLQEETRSLKSNLQKRLILKIWQRCDSLERMLGLKEVSFLTMKQVLEQHLPWNETDRNLVWRSGNAEDFITKRDLQHYSSVAYAYRAILSVQQDALFNSDLHLLPLSSESARLLKEAIDQFTLLVLKRADQSSRTQQQRSITPPMFEKEWKKLSPFKSELVRMQALNTEASFQEQLKLVKSIIQKKKEAFEKYNQISMFIFQRNAQVYFSRHGWPKDEKENERFRAAYNETMILFVKDVWLAAEQLAKAANRPLIRMEDVSKALEQLLPYAANELEDITFFPKLPRARQLDVEAYDLDAFRDGGAHWTYMEMALGDLDFEPKLMADPFALELLSEGVAHMGVLSLRMAGIASKALGHERLDRSDFLAGLEDLRKLLQDHAQVVDGKPQTAILSAQKKEKSKAESNGQRFLDVTSASGIDFEHRSADWLSRFIRSYRVDSAENVVKTSIPPAFGGGGVAAEDLNNDGYADLLLLSGLGNKLYINNGEGGFDDRTQASGITWKREEDKFPGEPRQPIIADFDNDGWQDIFISYVNDDHRMYRNRGDGTFEDLTQQAALGGKGLVGGPATAIDFDSDGLLDLYIGYFGDYLHAIHPTLARRNRNGLPNMLYRNKGNFAFERLDGAGVEDFGWSQSIGHTDLNQDGRQDLVCGNDFGSNSYYINNGDGTFTDQSRALGTDKPSFTMNVGVTDLNRDHRPDLYISNIVVMEKDEKYVDPSASSPMRFNASSVVNMRVVEANDLFLSGTGQNGETPYVLSSDVARGESSTGWSWDADFFDFDNDGDQDLYCLTGMNDFLVYSTENPYYEDPDGVGRKVFFADSHRESNVFFVNENGKLMSGNKDSGLDVVFNSRSAAYLDFDRDGDEDILLSNYHDKAMLFENRSQVNGNHWLKLKLVGNPEQGVTRDAIGATITVTAKDLDVWHELHSTTGYLSVHPKEQHLGVGQHKEVDVRVLWPNGEEQRFGGVECDFSYTLEQGKQLKKNSTR